MMKRLLALLTATLLGGIGAVTAAAPAQAALSDCLNGYICLWTASGYSGNLYQWTPGYIRTLPGRCLVLTSGIDNQTSSIAGKFGSIGSPVTFFDGYGGGANFAKGNNFSDDNLANSTGAVPGGWNDKISAICSLL